MRPAPASRVISDRRTDLPEGGLPWSLISDLTDLIPSDCVVFCGFAHKPHGPTWFVQQTSPDDADDEAYWQHKQDCPTLCYPERGGDLRKVIKYSDFYSPLWGSKIGHRGMTCGFACGSGCPAGRIAGL
jgi:hypothetical protein